MNIEQLVRATTISLGRGSNSLCNNIALPTFDVIVSNPPYQASNNTGIYHHFMNIAQKLSKNVSMIYPAKWLDGGKGEKIDEFRQKELHSQHYKTFTIYSGDKDVFTHATIKGGINYFHWTQTLHNSCDYTFDNIHQQRTTLLNNHEIMLRNPQFTNIIEKIHIINSLSKSVANRNHYGPKLESGSYIESLTDKQDMRIFYSGHGSGIKEKWIDKDNTSRVVSDYKIFVSKTADPSSFYPLRRPARVFIAQPYEICSSTFLKMGSYTTFQEALYNIQYFKTDFVNFLFAVITATHNTTARNYSLIPDIDFTTGEIKDKPGICLNFNEPDMLDIQLADIYGLTVDERRIIENSVRPWKDKCSAIADGLY